ncbi:MAG: hypothetical protein ACOCZ5_00340 [bacterium]
MTFFNRPNLEDLQFRQISGSTLTLSGTTKIASQQGLELMASGNTFVPINIFDAGSGTDGYSLVYDNTQGVIRLMDISGGTASNMYNGRSPSTIEVGGIDSGSVLTGRTVQDILQEMLSPAIEPSVSEPNHLLSIIPPSTNYEVGCVIDITRNVDFNRGSVSPVYDSSGDEIASSQDIRAGNPVCYDLSGGNVDPKTITCSGSSISEVTNNYEIQPGNNTIRARVFYSSGQTIYDSEGNEACAALSSGSTSQSAIVIAGRYPWFFGTTDTMPDLSKSADRQTLLSNSICKCIASSTGNLVMNFCVCCPDEYIWFATPAASATKSKWSGSNANANTGNIPGSLFPSPETESVDSPDGCWSGEDYKIYVSNYPTNTFDGNYYTMTFCN